MNLYSPAAALQDALTTAGIPVATVRSDNGALEVVYAPEATPAQQTQGAAIVAAFVSPGAAAALRDAAVRAFALADFIQQEFRAVVLVMRDELNVLRKRLRDQDATVAAATGLPVAFRNAWALLTPMPDRTIAQAKTALTNKANSPEAD